jgi:uncharacterized membrane protein
MLRSFRPPFFTLVTMIDFIFAFKFVHLVAAAAMFGTWLGMALFMRLADRSGNTSVVALTSRFVVSLELRVMAGAIALQPISGVALALAIGLSPLDEFWIVVSLALYVLIVAAWLAALRIEMLIRTMARQAALDSVPLPDAYRRLYRVYSALVWPTLAMMVAVFALMTWQPRPW